MKREQLNDELTIIGIILILMFVSYYFIVTHLELQKNTDLARQAMTLSVELHDELTIVKSDLQSTKSDLVEYKHLDKILKDIRSSWSK